MTMTYADVVKIVDLRLRLAMGGDVTFGRLTC